jgi:hypothetical protein
MNPQLFVMTLGGIGVEMAVARTIAVFIFSFTAGLLAYIIPAKYMVKKNINHYDDGGYKIINREKKFFIVKQYLINCMKDFKHVGVYLLIGIFIGAVTEIYIPRGVVQNALRAGHVQSVLFGALLGIPMYACGGGAIPFISSMLSNGMGKGSALAFFMVGPATRPAPLIAMSALFLPLFLLGYCVFLIFLAVLMGFIYV